MRGESAFARGEGGSIGVGIDRCAGEEPDPQFLAIVTEECQLLWDGLDDPLLPQIAMYKFEGYTNQEIADMRECSLATVKRKVRQIRTIWEQ